MPPLKTGFVVATFVSWGLAVRQFSMIYGLMFVLGVGPDVSEHLLRVGRASIPFQFLTGLLLVIWPIAWRLREIRLAKSK